MEHDLFGKPASTPDQVRGKLFPDHVLGAGALDLVFGSAGGEQFHRLRAVEFPDAQLFVETNEAFENIGGAGEIGKAHRPITEYALVEARSAMQDVDVAVAPVGHDAGEDLVDRALFAFECLQKGAVVKTSMPLTPSALLRLRAPSKSFFRSAVEKSSEAVLV